MIRRNLWTAVLAGMVAGLVLGVVEPAHAQSACRHYVNAGFSIDMEGTTAEACEALRVALSSPIGVGRPATTMSCTATETGVVGVYRFSDPFDEFPQDMAAVGACSAEPPASEPTGDFAGFTQSQSSNLLAWGFLVLLFGIGFIGGRQR